MRLSLVLGALFAVVGAASSAPPAEVIVIGTVHEPSSAYNADVLARILKELKPGVVLLEGDPSFFDGNKGLKEKYRGSVEGKAVSAYQEASGVAP